MVTNDAPADKDGMSVSSSSSIRNGDTTTVTDTDHATTPQRDAAANQHMVLACASHLLPDRLGFFVAQSRVITFRPLTDVVNVDDMHHLDAFPYNHCLDFCWDNNHADMVVWGGGMWDSGGYDL